VSPHHLKGGDLVWQVGTGYFGCREPDGRFSMARLKETIARAPQIRAIEIKLSQGAKPGVGGLLPQAKITREIAEISRSRSTTSCRAAKGCPHAEPRVRRAASLRSSSDMDAGSDYRRRPIARKCVA